MLSVYFNRTLFKSKITLFYFEGLSKRSSTDLWGMPLTLHFQVLRILGLCFPGFPQIVESPPNFGL